MNNLRNTDYYKFQNNLKNIHHNLQHKLQNMMRNIYRYICLNNFLHTLFLNLSHILYYYYLLNFE